MTDQRQIVPPPHLLKLWTKTAQNTQKQGGPFAKTFALAAINWAAPQIATQAADQELEACCKWLKAKEWIHPEFSDELRAARRPKPPSLKAQALAIVENLGCCDRLSPKQQAVLNRALEALPDD